MQKIFIVILNWNKPDLTLECLESVSQLSINNYQLTIVVVDNASDDDSVVKISNLKSQISNLNIIENQANLGFAGGNNVGIRHALKNHADYVMVLNNDTEVDKNLLTGLLKAFEKNEQVGVVSPKIYFAKGFEFHRERYKPKDLGRVIWYAGGFIDWQNIYGSNRGVDEVDEGHFDKEENTDFATGSCSLFSSKALKKIGLYDERYYMYFEDTDLSMRMKKNRFKVIYSPKGFLWHKVAQSSGIGSDLNDYFITRNRLLFGLKYASLKTKFALIRESLTLMPKGRKWQKIGVKDFYLRKFGRGSWL